MNALDNLKQALGDPEYLFLLLEPLFIYGILLGIVVFVIAFFLKDGKAQSLGLIIVLLSCFAIWPYLKFREKAEARIAKVYSIEDPTKASGFKEQTQRRRDTQWVFFALGTAAGVVLLIGSRTNRMGLVFGIGTAAGGIAVVIFSMSLHLGDSKVYHPNLLKQSTVARTSGGG